MSGTILDQEQLKSLLEAIAKSAVTQYAKEHAPEPPSTATTVLRYLAGIFGAIGSGIFIAGSIWLFSTLNDVQLSLRDVTTAIGHDGIVQARFQEIDRRISNLEELHKQKLRRAQND